jgi:hypothetical protein
MAGSCGHNNEPLGSIKSEEFLDKTSDGQLLTQVCAPQN